MPIGAQQLDKNCIILLHNYKKQKKSPVLFVLDLVELKRKETSVVITISICLSTIKEQYLAMC